jgi:uncharacterized protein YciI
MPYSNKEQLAEGRRLEQAGQLEAAATAYRKLVDRDFHHQEAVGRLLVVYRKLKDHRGELAVINEVLAAFRKENKEREEKWMREHSGAAAAGRAIFRQLGGASMAGFGVDPEVTALTRRKEVVERKVMGKKAPAKKAAGKKAAAKRTKVVTSKGEKIVPLKREKIVMAKREKEKERKEKAAARREEVKRRKQEAAERKAQAAAAKKAEREAAAEAKKYPTLFVILLRYQVPLEEIDAAMKAHVAFLDRHYKKGDLLVSGRQEPRTGGVILARGKDRDAVERMMKGDPFVKGGLAEVEVVEFRASRMGKGLARSLR